MAEKRRIRVVAAIFVRDGKVLAGQRPEGDGFAGEWEFPGGKVGTGEGDEAALHREIEEELGAKIRVGSKFDEIHHDYETVSVDLIFFLAEFLGEIPSKSEAHQKLAWISKNELDRYVFLKGDLPLIPKLRQIL